MAQIARNMKTTPIGLIQGYTSPDRAAAKRVFDAMMTMNKIDIPPI